VKIYRKKVILSNEKYELYRTNYLEHQEKNQKPQFRATLFGNDNIGDDISFTWVNKDNILSVFDKFTSTVTENKDTYSREDWDEIKMLYEALGTRKNTVEKEGLSSSDNMKIASIKVKFAPMLAINRAGEKSKENAEAKE
jgi:trehalose-6-phosphatase